MSGRANEKVEIAFFVYKNQYWLIILQQYRSESLSVYPPVAASVF